MSHLNSPHSSEDELPSIKELCEFNSKDSQQYSKPQVYPLRPAKKSLRSCTICGAKYNNSNNLPFLLPACGHTFCKNCLTKMSYKAMIRCAICSCMTYKELKKLPVNYALLEAFESQNKKPLCKDHNSELIVYCVNDDSLLCGKCTLSHRSHKLYLLTDPKIMQIANDKQKKMQQEAEDLVKLQKTWNKTKDEHLEGLKSLKLAVSRHGFALSEVEKDMISKVNQGTNVCVKEIEEVIGDEFQETKRKVEQNIEKIKNRLNKIQEIKASYDRMPVVEKLNKILDREQVNYDEPPSLFFVSRILEKLKGKVDYENCIKQHQLIIN